MTRVPMADLHRQYLDLKDDIDAAISEVIRTSAFVRGPFVEAFEREYAALMGAAQCVSCANGTDAIYVAMHGLGIKPGDEVITTSFSWISTSETISQHGATPVFVDIDPKTYTIDPAAIEAKISERTVGIIPVHLYGQAADMAAVMDIAGRHGLWVVEDCAQAHLATFNGRKVGTFGNAATWSFYPGKNLGAMGDAGAITTDDTDLAYRMARFARHGGIVKGDHEIEGINSRLDGIQAAVLRVKMPHLERWTEARRAHAERYDALLGNLVSTPAVAPGRGHVYHLYVIEHAERDALKEALASRGIQSSVNYPIALPFLPAYERFGATPDQFPNAFAAQSRILSLPMFAEMTDGQVDAVGQAVIDFATAGAHA